MAIAQGYKDNFETMQRAFANGDVAVVECYDRKTGDTVVALCAVDVDPNLPEDVQYNITPLAKMFDGNPFEELISPMEKDAGVEPEGLLRMELNPQQVQALSALPNLIRACRAVVENLERNLTSAAQECAAALALAGEE